ncbi:hypothetical protein [Streptomyces lavendulocolor]
MRPSDEVPGAVLAALAGVRTGRIATREPTLEDAYVAIIGRAGEAAQVPA